MVLKRATMDNGAMNAYAPIIKEIGRGAKGARALDREQAARLFGDMLDGRVDQLELGAILIALRIKSETTDELIGFKQAMDARIARVAVPDGPRCVIIPSYNGARRQANLMPLLARLLARRGIPVLIHGFHDFADRADPFRLLGALGIEPASDVTQAAAQLAEQHIACLRLETLLPGLAGLLALRSRLGVRASGHTLAKLLDPCPGRSLRVVAVTHPEYLERMHAFLSAERAWAMLLRGTEGEVFANPRRRPRVDVFADGVAHVALTAEEGGAPPLAGLPDCPDPEDNARLIVAMLAGEQPVPQPILDQVEALTRLACAPAVDSGQG